MIVMQPTIFHSNENRNGLRASSPLMGYREKSRASGTRRKTREQGAGKESERSLARLLATRNEEVATSPYHFLVVLRVCYSLSQFTLGIPRKNSSYLPHIRVIQRHPSERSDSVLL